MSFLRSQPFSVHILELSHRTPASLLKQNPRLRLLASYALTPHWASAISPITQMYAPTPQPNFTPYFLDLPCNGVIGKARQSQLVWSSQDDEPRSFRNRKFHKAFF